MPCTAEDIPYQATLSPPTASSWPVDCNAHLAALLKAQEVVAERKVEVAHAALEYGELSRELLSRLDRAQRLQAHIWAHRARDGGISSRPIAEVLADLRSLRQAHRAELDAMREAVSREDQERKASGAVAVERACEQLAAAREALSRAEVAAACSYGHASQEQVHASRPNPLITAAYTMAASAAANAARDAAAVREKEMADKAEAAQHALARARMMLAGGALGRLSCVVAEQLTEAALEPVANASSAGGGSGDVGRVDAARLSAVPSYTPRKAKGRKQDL